MNLLFRKQETISVYEYFKKFAELYLVSMVDAALAQYCVSQINTDQKVSETGIDSYWLKSSVNILYLYFLLCTSRTRQAFAPGWWY